MSPKDYELFSNLVSLTQPQMKKIMSKYLRQHYDNVIETDHYIVATGDTPIALVAHMDTVFPTPVREIYYDRDKDVIWSPEGLGSDDRAGIYAIIKILQRGVRPTVILTTDEEKGGIGAMKLAADYPDGLPARPHYLIELDRRGYHDCVFYQCHSPMFYDYVCSFGFELNYGSFSDITFLMDQWEICGTNLSVGYVDEHSDVERLHVNWLEDTIVKVYTMLVEKEIPTFKYSSSYSNMADFADHCDCCGKLVDVTELIPVVGSTGEYKQYCLDCFVKKDFPWCESCGEAFEPNDISTTMCYECCGGVESCIPKSKKL